MSKLQNNIEKLTDKDVKYFSFEGFKCKAKIASVYDGDTISIIFNHNNNIIKYRCRCYGYDSAEMRPLKTKLNRDEEIAKAKKAKKRLIELLENDNNGIIDVECGKFDKYGRILIKIYINKYKKYVDELMIDEGHGKPYYGGHKIKW